MTLYDYESIPISINKPWSSAWPTWKHFIWSLKSSQNPVSAGVKANCRTVFLGATEVRLKAGEWSALVARVSSKSAGVWSAKTPPIPRLSCFLQQPGRNRRRVDSIPKPCVLNILGGDELRFRTKEIKRISSRVRDHFTAACMIGIRWYHAGRYARYTKSTQKGLVKKIQKP